MTGHKAPDSTPHKRNLSVDRRDARRYGADLRVGFLHRDNYIFCTTRNICVNGLSCLLSVPLPLFTKYRMRLDLCAGDHGESDRWIEVDGIVVRVEEADQGEESQFQTAVYFSHVSEADRDRLEEFLREHGSTD